MKRIVAVLCALLSVSAFAQNPGGITDEMLAEISGSFEGNASDIAVRNALNAASISALSETAGKAMADTHFSDRVKTHGITDQKQSGRCWLFTGLNVLRAAAIDRHDLGAFQFSQSYCFFWDQLEKANLFLQAVIDTRDKPFDDREVDWLFSNPIGDGGTFTGVANLVMKYGVVPAEVMPESLVANSTSAYSAQMKNLLRQYGLKLREPLEGIKPSKQAGALQAMKVDMLKDVYRVLALCLGEPPREFDWAMYNAKDELVSEKHYTPVEFYREMVGFDLNNNYVMLMNDPSREYGRMYEIQYDRHLYDGQNWVYLNLPVDRIKEMAIASIRDNNAMYFSCDVSKFLDRSTGVLDLDNYDYGSLLGVDFTMDKKQRVMTHASGSSHAMTLIAVDVRDGKPVKWMVENSWGEKSGYKGCLIMTDEWFDEYMFRLVVDRKYIPADLLPALDGKPEILPAWDPMYLMDETPQYPELIGDAARMSDEEKAERMAERLKKELNLDEKAYRKLVAWFRKDSAFRESQDAKLRKILTPEQYEQLSSMKWRRQHHRHSGPTPGEKIRNSEIIK